ncbi:hypothetical protein SAMN05444344_1529 [Tenacibaculum mesophilum]|uniref:Uncharacterized protein n=1 Tax=Tenacibaculum mesophilum TaxID=104268 RepID=A0ABN5T5U7_9FLAO|nr:hypothetical protein [Tenacibaculum mesophilum]AZJ32736.1 hypothetical protein D6200_09275 [Tenacibaculum mesophilum]QFS27987.1 hypothetical protein F9Y86_06115 [Tenacibaculum mesophilum]SHF75419.1 hypothetical protein SAMN05444344_1529 [Tenacibaculum mesophilum]
MASINVNTTVEAPEEITINLVREDYLETSNTYRLFFEICLAISCAIIGNMISFEKVEEIPPLNWFFLTVMIFGCVAFFLMTSKNYKKAKSKVGQK